MSCDDWWVRRDDVACDDDAAPGIHLTLASGYRTSPFQGRAGNPNPASAGDLDREASLVGWVITSATFRWGRVNNKTLATATSSSSTAFQTRLVC